MDRFSIMAFNQAFGIGNAGNETPTDRQCEAAVRAYGAARSYLQGFHYPPRLVLRDLRKAPGEQEIWRGPETDHGALEDRIEIECMREALVAASKAARLTVVSGNMDEWIMCHDIDAA